MSNKEKPLAKITIEVYDDVVNHHTKGNAYFSLVGLAVVTNNVIKGIPEALQQETRAEFLRLLNEAATGKLFMEE